MLISPAFAQSAGGDSSGMLMQIAPLILIFVVFYFLLIRPQQKRMKQHRELVSNLRRGDRIVAGGGIIGTVAKVVNDTEILVEIAEGVRVRMMRAQVTEIAARGAPAPDAKSNGGDRPGPANEDRKTGMSGLFGKITGR